MSNEFNKIVRVALIEESMTMTELAKRLDIAQSNLSKKLSKNNFNETDMHKVANALGKKLKIGLE